MIRRWLRIMREAYQIERAVAAAPPPPSGYVVVAHRKSGLIMAVRWDEFTMSDLGPGWKVVEP